MSTTGKEIVDGLEGLLKPKARRKASKSPTVRTLDVLKQLGFTAQVVERFNSFTKHRIDLFGCIDIIAVKPGVGVIGIQATANTGGCHAARLDKIKAEPRMRTWIESGARLEIWSWAKQGARGQRKLWTLRREELTLADLQSA